LNKSLNQGFQVAIKFQSRQIQSHAEPIFGIANLLGLGWDRPTTKEFKMKFTLATLVLVMGFSFSSLAEEQKAPDQQHATEPQQDKAMEGMNHGMMGGKMDMAQMHAMMGECMKMHKDGKMCEGSMMEQCQKNMGKNECSQMMKKAKAPEKK
jgi:hypothetical protein